MDAPTEIIVARPDRATVAIVAITVAFLVIGGGVNAAVPFQILLAGIGVAAVRRFVRMHLTVTPTSVIVQNYVRRYEVDLPSLRIVAEHEPLAWPEEGVPGSAAATPAAHASTGRALYLVDGSGRRARVGLAPRRGSRLDTIAEDLYRAIDRMRRHR